LAPIDYRETTDLSVWTDYFDLAFSYEVIYLLPDITGHANDVYSALRSGGVYYAVTGCHTDSPLWPSWRGIISESTNGAAYDRSPDEYASAFQAAGFDVSVRRFGYSGFVPVSKDRSYYYPKLTDALDYAAEHKLLFRFAKP
jgi:hypothetical protein